MRMNFFRNALFVWNDRLNILRLELQELKALMITRIEGAGGKYVVTVDEALSEAVV